MKILTFPNSFLTKKCSSVIHFNEELFNNIQNMFELMEQSKGIGLAANQVGISQYFFIMKLNDTKHIFINPIIEHKSEELIQFTEGCLSFPYFRQETQRSKTISLKWQDTNGDFHSQTFFDLEAICIQHEIDHLNGKTFLDLLSPLKKQFALKKYLKIQKA